MSKLFACLTLYHLPCLIACTYYYVKNSITCRTDYVSPIARRFASLGLSGSIYTTIMISIERNLALCHPFLKWRKNISLYLVTIVVIVGCYDFPYFFDLEYCTKKGSLGTKYKSWNDEMYRKRYYI